MTRVLVVDDEPEILESTRQLLDALGYEARVCSEAHRVLEVMKDECPDIVLHDVRMPDLDIRAQIRSIRGDAQVGKVAIILFTATFTAMELVVAVGADDGIEKPFDTDVLAALLRKWAPKRRFRELV